jgi:hypothetical protein
MDSQVNIVALMERWLNANAGRLSGRFEVKRVTDWSGWKEQGIALDLFRDDVAGRITAWPANLVGADWPIADAEAMDARTGQQFFCWTHEHFSPALLDRWLDALEIHTDRPVSPSANGKMTR